MHLLHLARLAPVVEISDVSQPELERVPSTPRPNQTTQGQRLCLSLMNGNQMDLLQSQVAWYRLRVAFLPCGKWWGPIPGPFYLAYVHNIVFLEAVAHFAITDFQQTPHPEPVQHVVDPPQVTPVVPQPSFHFLQVRNKSLHEKYSEAATVTITRATELNGA